MEGVNIELVRIKKYLGLLRDNKLDWSANTEHAKKSQTFIRDENRVSLELVLERRTKCCPSYSTPVTHCIEL